MNINGRFQKVSTNPVVVGLIGTATPKKLNAANIEYIKDFYNQRGKSHRFIDDFPVAVNRSIYNGFIVFE